MSYTETLEPVRGYTIKLVAMEDTQGLDPRDNDCNLGVMMCWHTRYDLGDATAEGDQLKAAIEGHRGGRTTLPLIERYCRIAFGSTVVIPLGLIDHSGISMYVGGGAHWSDGGGWDSGTVGFIFDTEVSRKAGWGDQVPTYEQVRDNLISEVIEYDKYLTGDVWGAVIEDGAGNEVESCWGFLGSEYAKEEAQRMVPDEPARVPLDEDERDALYDALTHACQANGFTSAETYDHLHAAIATITKEVTS